MEIFMSLKNAAPSERTRVKRGHLRANYEKQTIHDILDAMPICHVSYILDGAPVVTPTLQWRQGNHVYWHGSSASRMIKKSAKNQVCMAVTILDGMVLARSAFHHSVNYRSVTLFGKASVVDDPVKAEASLRTMVEHLFPGRWELLREMTDKELKATTVLSMPIDEASAKIRSGPPVDDDEDYELPIWAGVIPISHSIDMPENDPRILAGVEMPDHTKNFKIG